MPAINITLSESVSGDSLLIRAPAPEFPVVVRQPGTTHLTAGGGIAQYRVGAANWEATLTIPSLTNSKKTSLELFFRSHWGKSTVSYRDENLVTFSGVRFLDDELQLTKIARDLWTCSLRLRFPSVVL
jgi:hypothetical protein